MKEVNRVDSEGLTLPQLLQRWAQQVPYRTALREKDLGIWKGVTWLQYWHNVRDLARGLHEIGFRAGDRLAIASEDSPEWLYADLAAQALGGICVGIYPTNPWPEVQYILNHSEATVVVCGDQEQVDKILDAKASPVGLPSIRHVYCVDMKGLRHYDEAQVGSLQRLMELGRACPDIDKWFERAVSHTRPDDVAVIVYTSGTTGAPKGAMLSHRNFICSTQGIVNEFGFTDKNHSVLCYLPLCHVAERSFSQVSHLICGSVINFAESVDAVQSNLREIAPLIFFGVPRIWEKMQQTVQIRVSESSALPRRLYVAAMRVCGAIVDAEESGQSATALQRAVMFAARWVVFKPILRHFGLDRVNAAFAGGASVPPDVVRFFRILGLTIYQAYGLTETAAVAFIQRPRYTKRGHTGLPVEGVEYKIADDGEMLIRGASVFKGYFKDQAATDATLADGWLHSGDIVERDVGGEIAIVDRKKEIIITSGGKNIAPSEIENALKESFFIREAIIIGDGRHFVSALLQIDMHTVGKWAQENGLTFTTFKSLSRLPQVRNLIQAEVDRANGRFARVERVREFVLLDKELDHDDGELTATMKVRRRAIEKKFAAEIRQIYEEAA
ncbi:AMP-binding protein [Cupriavidus metallidurans]|uniref:AMP-dependent synthetase/ligase n=1 Tax=Cupriavidus TaxID=106589 RepID=UPI00257A2D6C|nr:MULTISPECIES: AMP-binding protein [unclassified Cupriavidus]GMG94216.1 long-chain-fatty-acid--CoA ligase [Cupriavidus sp. TKC]